MTTELLECLKDARRLLTDPEAIDLAYLDAVIAKSEAAIEERDRLREALQNMLGVYDTPLSRRRFPQDEFMKEAIATARAALNPATDEGREP